MQEDTPRHMDATARLSQDMSFPVEIGRFVRTNSPRVVRVLVPLKTGGSPFRTASAFAEHLDYTKY